MLLKCLDFQCCTELLISSSSCFFFFVKCPARTAEHRSEQLILFMCCTSALVLKLNMSHCYVYPVVQSWLFFWKIGKKKAPILSSINDCLWAKKEKTLKKIIFITIKIVNFIIVSLLNVKVIRCTKQFCYWFDSLRMVEWIIERFCFYMFVL